MADRAIPAASARAMLDAGLARILVPRRFGGHELGLDVWSDASGPSPLSTRPTAGARAW